MNEHMILSMSGMSFYEQSSLRSKGFYDTLDKNHVNKKKHGLSFEEAREKTKNEKNLLGNVVNMREEYDIKNSQ